MVSIEAQDRPKKATSDANKDVFVFQCLVSKHNIQIFDQRRGAFRKNYFKLRVWVGQV